MKVEPYVAGVATVAVALALLNMPYGYYTLLRLGLCAACAYYLLALHRNLGPGLKVLLSAFVVLYNPVFPVHLREKPLWSVANLATVVVLWLPVLRAPQQAGDGGGKAQ